MCYESNGLVETLIDEKHGRVLRIYIDNSPENPRGNNNLGRIIYDKNIIIRLLVNGSVQLTRG